MNVDVESAMTQFFAGRSPVDDARNDCDTALCGYVTCGYCTVTSSPSLALNVPVPPQVAVLTHRIWL